MKRTLFAGLFVLALSGGAAQAGFSGDSIRIGVLNDRYGLYSDFGGEGSVIAARMAAEEFGWEIAGRPIEILFADHANDPAVGGEVTRRWIDEEGVDAIADVPTSSVAFEVQRITHEKNRIFLIASAAAVGLTGESCSPTSFHWTHDTHALGVGTAHALLEEGGTDWFFLTVDDVFGRSLEEEAAAEVERKGGRVLGHARHALGGAHDHHDVIREAARSGAKVIGLANGGTDATEIIREAHQMGVLGPDQQFAGLLLFLTDIHRVGLEAAQGMRMTTGFYWDRTEETRAWSRRFFERRGAMPTAASAGTYSAVRHYLRAVEQAGTDAADVVARTMRNLRVQDMFAEDGYILSNGRMVHDLYLVRVKSPEESREPWDYYEIVRPVSGEHAFHPPEESGCTRLAE